MTRVAPADVVRYASEADAGSISWTYNEPTIWHEFTIAASIEAHDAGLRTNYVTNGYISEEPLRELKGVIDAMNIDVKAFRNEFYEEVCKGSLEPVLSSCVLALELGIHLELTYLIIPGYNDSDKEVAEFSSWVAESLHRSVPVHFSAFHPDYRLTEVSRTPTRKLHAAYDIARKAGLDFVYIGNVYAGDKDDTHCPKCGSAVIVREGFRVESQLLNNGRCSKCDGSLNMIV